ncbi:MAG: hypothetical protein GX100_02240 [candidate division WS1 bacterium]|nr:hypothetical protein [candidate division WS1 bacterium]
MNSRQILSTLIVVLLVVAGLEWARQESFLLFHSLAEIFSVVIACAVFLLAWNSRDFVRNYYLLWVGIAYLFVAGLDVVHTLTFRGMGVFPDLETDTPTQLWVAARLLQAVALVVAPAFIRRRPAILPTFAGMGAYAVLVLLAVFRWKVFPVCYIDDPQVGYPLTAFKIYAEWTICALLAVAIYLLWRVRAAFEPAVLLWLTAALVTIIVSEIWFTTYRDAYAVPNALGHYFKILAFYFTYRALVDIGFRRPYQLLLRELKQSRDSLGDLNDSLEIRVRERTAEVEQRADQLRSLALELTRVEQRERRRLAEMLHDHLQQLLVAARLRLQLAQDGVSPEEVQVELQKAEEYLEEAIRGSRSLTVELSPPMLHEGGLGGALRWLGREMNEKHGLQVSVEVASEVDPGTEEAEEFLFQAARELLFNVVKHAQTPRAWVRLTPSGTGALELAVRDDGVGIDLSRLARPSAEDGHFGLFSLRERLEALGGHLTIESAPGQGTEVRLLMSQSDSTRDE